MGELVNGKLFFFYFYFKHYVVVLKKTKLYANFQIQVISERRNTGVLFYNTLYQKNEAKKNNNQMIILKNQKAEMVLPVFPKAVFDFCCFPASQKNKQI